jgi:isocitrate lyase
VDFDDQLASEKKCGHLGGKVLVPTSQFVRTLVGARLASDALGVSTVLVSRTDALSAALITSDADPADAEFLTGERTSDGFFRVHDGLEPAIARRFADAIHVRHPRKLLAYNCSPSFNWRKHLSDAEIATFQQELGSMGYRFQFVTLAGFHALNESMFELARGLR